MIPGSAFSGPRGGTGVTMPPMGVVDWVVAGAFLVFVVADGLLKARRSKSAEDYLLASRSVPWWAMGLSVMATQASAITFVGTTGQGFTSGTGFAQFYYFLPVAMILLCVTAVPFFHRTRVFTAYEYLERRFDRRTRLATSSTFLVLRCLSLGGILAAPAFVLSEFTGQSYGAMVALMAVVAVVYTSLGGLKAVIATDVKQMAVMFVALFLLFAFVVGNLPRDVGLAGAMSLADEAGKVTWLDTSFDPDEKYTIWSALLGGTIIFLSYFGTDQSQVQRYLAGRSLEDMRGALVMNAVLKVPFQCAILVLGVLIWVWSLYDPMPMVRHSATHEQARTIEEYDALEMRHDLASRLAGHAGRVWLRSGGDADREKYLGYLAVKEKALADASRALEDADIDRPSEANDVVPWVMKHRLPRWGLVGLLLAGILAAALSSIDSELNALATVATIDAMGLDPDAPDAAPRIVRWTRIYTIAFGAAAAGFALTLRGGGALIEVVNMVGSWFYGSLLGVFLLAWLTRFATGTGAVAGLGCGITAVAIVDGTTDAAWLWMNTVGVVVTVVVGLVVSLTSHPSRPE